MTIHTIENANSYHTLLFSSDFWILYAIESINQSITIHTIENANSYHTLLFSSDFWILYAIESINQSINQRLKCNAF